MNVAAAQTSCRRRRLLVCPRHLLLAWLAALLLVAGPASAEETGEDEQETGGGGQVTARYGDDSVTVPTLWVVFAAGACDTEREIVDPLTDRVRLAYRVSPVPADLGVEVSLRVQRAVTQGETRDIETLPLPARGSAGTAAVHSLSWAPPAAGTYRFQVVLRVTDVPPADRPAPNPQRMEARSPWHTCVVTFAPQPPVAVVNAQAAARWLPAQSGEPRLAEVTMHVEVRTRDTTRLRSATRFRYAAEARAPWRALLPAAETWQAPDDHTLATGGTVRLARRVRFAADHWPEVLALRVEWLRNGDGTGEAATPMTVAVLQLTVAGPDALAARATLLRYDLETGSELAEVAVEVAQPR